MTRKEQIRLLVLDLMLEKYVSMFESLCDHYGSETWESKIGKGVGEQLEELAGLVFELSSRVSALVKKEVKDGRD